VRIVVDDVAWQIVAVCRCIGSVFMNVHSGGERPCRDEHLRESDAHAHSNETEQSMKKVLKLTQTAHSIDDLAPRSSHASSAM
jgi:hypothetical protein